MKAKQLRISYINKIFNSFKFQIANLELKLISFASKGLSIVPIFLKYNHD